MLKNADDNDRSVFCKQRWWLFLRDTLFICSTVVTHSLQWKLLDLVLEVFGSFRLSYPRMV
jgi:hypothetical protein